MSSDDGEQQTVAFEEIQHGEIQFWRNRAIDGLVAIPISGVRELFHCLLVHQLEYISNNRSSFWLVETGFLLAGDDVQFLDEERFSYHVSHKCGRAPESWKSMRKGQALMLTVSEMSRMLIKRKLSDAH
jgi:hypothetical protein